MTSEYFMNFEPEFCDRKGQNEEKYEKTSAYSLYLANGRSKKVVKRYSPWSLRIISPYRRTSLQRKRRLDQCHSERTNVSGKTQDDTNLTIRKTQIKRNYKMGVGGARPLVVADFVHWERSRMTTPVSLHRSSSPQNDRTISGTPLFFTLHS